MPASAAASTASVAPCPSRSTTTRRFALVLVWILVSAFSYGFGISELNPLQPILTCHTRHPAPVLLSPTATRCIPLTESQFGLVTSLFTLGGLVSSFSISPLAKSLAWGRRASISLSSLFGLVGSLVLTFARSVVPLALGRFVQGLGSGIGVVVVPMYINEISPTSLQGSNGVLNQLSIVIGIFTAQVLGASRLGDGGESWRWIPATAAILSALQLAAGFLIGVESPGWLQGEGRKAGSEEQAYRARRLLWSADEVERHRQDAGRPAAGDGAAGTEETQRLLADGSTQDGSDDADDADDGREHSVGLVQILTDPEIRPGALMVVFTQLGQQLSGVNAVLYYSTGILSTIVPSLAGSIGIGITLINMLMTFPPIFLISEERVGRRNLMVLSAATMSLSSLLLGVGIVRRIAVLSATCIVAMVAAFSIGLGPIPFVILPELVPIRATSSATSLGLTLNWTANFIVGAAFLPLKNWFAAHIPDSSQPNADGGGGGAVFWIFAATNLVTAIWVARFYRYRPQRQR